MVICEQLNIVKNKRLTFWLFCVSCVLTVHWGSADKVLFC